jgi:cytidine deaminase
VAVPLSKDQEDALCEAALKARERAYAPYSNFRVGAALLVADGTILLGCNVENASYGLCLCAERTAIAGAVATGHQHFEAIAIATGSAPPSPPCGMCRQVLAEFCAELPIYLVNPGGDRVRVMLSKVFPSSFDRTLLSDGQDEGHDAGGGA